MKHLAKGTTYMVEKWSNGTNEILIKQMFNFDSPIVGQSIAKSMCV